MVNQDLIDNISRRFRQGQTKEEIKQALVDEGWEDIDIDEAIRHIQKTALSQLPLISAYTDFIHRLDTKTATLSTPAVLGICAFFALVVFLIAMYLYNWLDPFNIGATNRDGVRQTDLKQIQNSLQRYFREKNVYPDNLNQLKPTYLTTVPIDPKSHTAYEYKSLNDKMNYQLCINLETQPVQCVIATKTSEIPDVKDVISPQPKVASTLTGLVFLDKNGNGKRDDLTTETAFGNAAIAVTDSENNKVCETRTDPEGTFLCNLAKDDTFTVSLDVPVGYQLTSQNAQKVVMPNPTDSEQKSASVIFGLQIAKQ